MLMLFFFQIVIFYCRLTGFKVCSWLIPFFFIFFFLSQHQQFPLFLQRQFQAETKLLWEWLSWKISSVIKWQSPSHLVSVYLILFMKCNGKRVTNPKMSPPPLPKRTPHIIQTQHLQLSALTKLYITEWQWGWHRVGLTVNFHHYGFNSAQL